MCIRPIAKTVIMSSINNEVVEFLRVQVMRAYLKEEMLFEFSGKEKHW